MPRLTLLLLLTLVSLAAPAAVLTGAELPPFDSPSALEACSRFSTELGNRTHTTDARGNVTTYTYDALNRLTRTSFPDGTSRTITWRPDGRKAAESDQAGNTVQYGYDALGRLSQVTLTSGGTSATTTYAYDELGNKVSQTDAEGDTTRWAYDNASRVIKRTLPGGDSESFEYDAVGNRTGHSDFAGRRTSYAYDATNRLINTIAPDRTVTTAYTASGNVASLRDNSGTTRYQYDAQDRLTRQDNPDGSYLAYAYDANGNRSQLSTPAGTVNYAYDSLNRLTSVTGHDGKTTGYQYDAAGNRVKTTYPNGTESTSSFDSQNRLTGVTHSQAGKVIRGFQYVLRANGQRASVVESGPAGNLRTVNYAYDSLNRLTGVDVTDHLTGANSKTIAYAYGKSGNRTSETVTQGGSVTTTAYQYDANDRLTSATQTSGSGATAQSTTTAYAWDASGNLAKKATPAQTTLYQWNSDNRLTEVKRGATEASATSVATYRYDAQGNRIGKTKADGSTVSYLIDANQPYALVVEEKTATESTVYLHGIGLIQQTRGGQGTFYHADGLGSVRALSDAAGKLTDDFDYAPYGSLESHSGATNNDFRFAGEQFDEDAGLYYNRARWLDAETGRFVGLDPAKGKLREPISQNRYLYANADPINRKDPSGRTTLAETNVAMTGTSVMSSISIPTFVVASGITVSIGLASLTGEINLTMSEARDEPSDKEKSDAEAAQRQAEYRAAKDFCDHKQPDKGSNSCSSLSKQIDHAEQCVAMYEAWDNKWLPGRHTTKIADWKQRIRNLKDEHRQKCRGK